MSSTPGPRHERPTGVTVFAALLAAKGAASIFMGSRLLALDVAGAIHTGLISAGLSLAIGLALLWRAYALWRLSRGAWLITLLLVTVDIGITSWELVAGANTWTVWANLALAVVIVTYMLQPGVREQFQGRREDS